MSHFRFLSVFREVELVALNNSSDEKLNVIFDPWLRYHIFHLLVGLKRNPSPL